MELNHIFAAILIIWFVACLFFAITAVRKHVSFKWWVYYRAIKKSRKREWEAYVDYYNGAEGPERWERLLHITELLRRRRDLERWNQWVPEGRPKPKTISRVEVVSTDATCPSAVARDIAKWLDVNTSDHITKPQILEMIESYAIIQSTRPNGRKIGAITD